MLQRLFFRLRLGQLRRGCLLLLLQSLFLRLRPGQQSRGCLLLLLQRLFFRLRLGQLRRSLLLALFQGFPGSNGLFQFGREFGLLLAELFVFTGDPDQQFVLLAELIGHAGDGFRFHLVFGGGFADFQLKVLHPGFQQSDLALTGGQRGGGNGQFFPFFRQFHFQFAASAFGLGQTTLSGRDLCFQDHRIAMFFQGFDLVERGIPFGREAFDVHAGGRQLVFQRFGKLIVDFRGEQLPFLHGGFQLFSQRGIVLAELPERALELAELFGDRIVRLGEIVPLFDVHDQIFFQFRDFPVQRGHLGFQIGAGRTQTFQLGLDAVVLIAQDQRIGLDFFGKLIGRDPARPEFAQFGGSLFEFRGLLRQLCFQTGGLGFGFLQGIGQLFLFFRILPDDPLGGFQFGGIFFGKVRIIGGLPGMFRGQGAELFFQAVVLGGAFPERLGISGAFVLFRRELLFQLGGAGRVFPLLLLDLVELQFQGGKLFFQIGALGHQTADLFECGFRAGGIGTDPGQLLLEFLDLFFPQSIFLHCLPETAFQVAAGGSRHSGGRSGGRGLPCRGQHGRSAVQSAFRRIGGIIGPAFGGHQTAPAQIQPVFDHAPVPLRVLPTDFQKRFQRFLIQGQRFRIFAGHHLHFALVVVFETLPPDIPQFAGDSAVGRAERTVALCDRLLVRQKRGAQEHQQENTVFHQKFLIHENPPYTART